MDDRGDDYVTVPVVVMAIRPDSVHVRRGAVAAWLPRRHIHGADDNLLRAMRAGEEMKLRIRRWKASEAGLLFRETTQRSLFG
jgi:hypothetical protein